MYKKQYENNIIMQRVTLLKTEKGEKQMPNSKASNHTEQLTFTVMREGVDCIQGRWKGCS